MFPPSRTGNRCASHVAPRHLGGALLSRPGTLGVVVTQPTLAELVALNLARLGRPDLTPSVRTLVDLERTATELGVTPAELLRPAS